MQFGLCVKCKYSLSIIGLDSFTRFFPSKEPMTVNTCAEPTVLTKCISVLCGLQVTVFYDTIWYDGLSCRIVCANWTQGGDQVVDISSGGLLVNLRSSSAQRDKMIFTQSPKKCSLWAFEHLSVMILNSFLLPDVSSSRLYGVNVMC